MPLSARCNPRSKIYHSITRRSHPAVLWERLREDARRLEPRPPLAACCSGEDREVFPLALNPDLQPIFRSTHRILILAIIAIVAGSNALGADDKWLADEALGKINLGRKAADLPALVSKPDSQGKVRDKEQSVPGATFVAGSVYGGVIFTFTGGKVSRIFIGAAAE